MYQSELELIGLSPNEAKIYEALLNIGEAGVSDIASKSQVHRRSVYDTLMRLVDKGLVFQIFQKRENLYRAVDPRKCLDLLREKEKTFKKALPGLEHFYNSEKKEEEAFIYRGREGYKNYLRDLTKVADDVYFFGSKANWNNLDPDIEQLRKEFDSMMKKKKKCLKMLFDPKVKDQLLKKEYKRSIGEYKFLPSGYSTPSGVGTFGDYVVMFNSPEIGTFSEDSSIFVMINPKLAQSYKTWFQFMWDFCPEE